MENKTIFLNKWPSTRHLDARLAKSLSLIFIHTSGGSKGERLETFLLASVQEIGD